MPRPWDPDITVTPALAASLVEQQFPALAPVRVERIGAGWDNAAYLVTPHGAAPGEAYVFRFPQRRFAAPLMENEMRILPVLAPFLPLPVPIPRFHGAPTDHYPYRFAGARHIPGRTACSVTWTADQRAANAATLGRFLAALHAVSPGVTAPLGDEIGRADLVKRAPLVRGWLDEIRGPLTTETRRTRRFDGDDFAELATKVDSLSTTAPAATLCWVHGDLYARHLLVDDANGTRGIIDWGDAHVGDPALDISIAITFLPAEARPAFAAAYGAIDDATWDRAGFRAIHHGAALSRYGLETGDEAILEVGEYALRSALNLEPRPASQRPRPRGGGAPTPR